MKPPKANVELQNKIRQLIAINNSAPGLVWFAAVKEMDPAPPHIIRNSITISPEGTEVDGGPNDGAFETDGYAVELLSLARLLDEIEDVGFCCRTECGNPPHITVRGIYKKLPVMISLLSKPAEPPEDGEQENG